MLRIEDCGFTDEIIAKIKLLAKLFRAKKVILIDNKPNV